MPEVQAPAAPQLGAASAAPSGQSAPVQTPAIDPAEFNRFKSEYERLAPLEKQFQSGTKFYQTASQYGLKDENSLKLWGEAIKSASTKGVSPEKLRALFEAQREDQPAEAKPFSIEDFNSLLDKRDQARVLKDAKAQADKEMEDEFGYFGDDKLKTYLGDSADPKLSNFARLAAIGLHVTSRQPFPDGHPLAGQLGPVGKDFPTRLESFFKDGLTAAQAHKLARVGDAARRPAISTPAGDSSPGGKPANAPDTKGMSRDQRIAAADELARQKLGLA